MVNQVDYKLVKYDVQLEDSADSFHFGEKVDVHFGVHPNKNFSALIRVRSTIKKISIEDLMGDQKKTENTTEQKII
jgi:hypothetical protein